MLSFFKDYKKFAIGFFILSVIIISIIYSVLNVEKPLPVYQPANFEPKLVDSTIQHVKKYHTVPDFNLINQNGKTITQDDYEDKIYIADFFFTTCQSICPIMTDNMVYIQEQILNDDDVMLLSHSVTPEIDSVAQLKRYAIKKGVNDTKWNLVTGDRKQIYDLARKSYLVVEDDISSDYGMIHTENFALIDKKKQIRGVYNGISKSGIDSLLRDLKTLKKEYKQ
ncbi:SCO family protein [Lacinutrix sp.]|uniref:SCO family protein n=1 Tax=Lacinutrix sp. TaxID=1937692 RepID=UPI0025B92020|nr:SCO family protein [Lacinutrix sp.]